MVRLSNGRSGVSDFWYCTQPIALSVISVMKWQLGSFASRVYRRIQTRRRSIVWLLVVNPSAAVLRERVHM
jgi:hypothetical protein